MGILTGKKKEFGDREEANCLANLLSNINYKMGYTVLLCINTISTGSNKEKLLNTGHLGSMFKTVSWEKGYNLPSSFAALSSVLWGVRNATQQELTRDHFGWITLGNRVNLWLRFLLPEGWGSWMTWISHPLCLFMLIRKADSRGQRKLWSRDAGTGCWTSDYRDCGRPGHNCPNPIPSGDCVREEITHLLSPCGHSENKVHHVLR